MNLKGRIPLCMVSIMSVYTRSLPSEMKFAEAIGALPFNGMSGQIIEIPGLSSQNFDLKLRIFTRGPRYCITWFYNI